MTDRQHNRDRNAESGMTPLCWRDANQRIIPYYKQIPLLRAAVERDPDSHRWQLELATELLAAGSFEDAADAFQRAIAIEPDDINSHCGLADAWIALNHCEKAVQALHRAIDIDPTRVGSHVRLGNILEKEHRELEALAKYRHVLDLHPSHIASHNAIAQLLFAQGEYEDAVLACEATLQLNPGDSRALAIRNAAWSAMEQWDKVDLFVDFDRFLVTSHLNAGSDFGDLDQFNESLAQYVEQHPTLTFESYQKAIRSGWRARLSGPQKPPMTLLISELRHAVDSYTQSQCAHQGHPFMENRPDRVKLEIWANVFTGEGHETPHMHPAGWLSGVYYVKLPRSNSEPGGWIEFGKPEPFLSSSVTPRTRLVQPAEGMLVLFPSYFFHCTIPTDTDEQRISIAFDVIPVRE